jgi:L-aminopeptidase/D-esterase-like protein
VNKIALLLIGVASSMSGIAGAQTRTEATLPEPRTSFDGPSLQFDFPGLLIGTAEYDEGPTGVTVFYFTNGVKGAVDVRGGAPGTVNTDALRLGYEDKEMDAIVLAGSSWHGLSAVTGVADALRVQATDSAHPPRIWGVAGAIVNDIGSRGRRRRLTLVTADQRLAGAAVKAARPGRFFLGARGGGRFAMTGGGVGPAETSGEGGAFRQIGPTKIAVFTVVNAAGLVVDRTGQIMRCRAMHWGEKCGSIVDRLKNRVDSLSRAALDDSGRRVAAVNESGPTDNTTITLVVTNQKIPWWALNRLAVQVHTSMARAIQPFATASDGDVLYAVTTDEVDNPRLSPGDIGIIAGELAWDAVLSSVPTGDPLVATTRTASDAATLEANVGVYELGPGSRLSITRVGDRLVARSASAGRYLPPDVDVELVQIGKDDFLIDAPQRDVIRFERKGNRAEGLTINPGNWAIHARRVGPR